MSGKDYSPEELRIVAVVYPTEGPEGCVRAGLKRSIHSIKSKARDMGVKMTRDTIARRRREMGVGFQKQEPKPEPVYKPVRSVFDMGRQHETTC